MRDEDNHCCFMCIKRLFTPPQPVSALLQLFLLLHQLLLQLCRQVDQIKLNLKVHHLQDPEGLYFLAQEWVRYLFHILEQNSSESLEWIHNEDILHEQKDLLGYSIDRGRRDRKKHIEPCDFPCTLGRETHLLHRFHDILHIVSSPWLFIPKLLQSHHILGHRIHML